MRSLKQGMCMLAVAGLLLPSMAGAQSTQAVQADAIEPPASVSEWSGALKAEQLETLRGGAETRISNSNALNGAVTDNAAINLVTGSNSVSSDSFANLNGLAMVIQNSGNNVLIQSSTIVNLRLQ